MKKRIISIILALIMTTALLPMTITPAEALPMETLPAEDTAEVNYSSAVDVTPMQKKLLVISFDPVLPTRDGIRFTQYWEPVNKTMQAVTEDLVSRLNRASHGIINYTVTDYVVLNEFPRQKDGYSIPPEAFPDVWESARNQRGGWWNNRELKQLEGNSSFAYEYYIDELNLVKRKNDGEFDEIWMFLDFGKGYETVMVGRGAYWINGSEIEADCEPFRINHIAHHRDDTPLENLGHSAESILSRVYSSYKPRSESTWAKFTQYNKTHRGNAAVGNVHFAPNSKGDYDWGNNTKVWSTWRDWRDNYPNLTGQKELVDSSDWGNGSNLDHKTWWFSCFPHMPGRDERGYSNNWWEYYQNFVYTVSLELLLNNKQVAGTLPFVLKKDTAYNYMVMATLSSGKVMDVTNDCVISIPLNRDGNPYFQADGGALNGLISNIGVPFTAWRDGISVTVSFADGGDNFCTDCGEYPCGCVKTASGIDYDTVKNNEIKIAAKVFSFKNGRDIPADAATDADAILNLTHETISIPQTYAVQAFSTNAGVTWKAGGINNAALVQMLNKDLELWLCFKDFDTKAKKPQSGGANNIIAFRKINKRPAAPKLAINYALDADETGKTPGYWLLVNSTDVKKANPAPIRSTDIQIGKADSARKTVDNQHFGQFYDADAGRGIPVEAFNGSRATRHVYFVRIAPQYDASKNEYTAAGKTRKLTAAGQQKPPNFKVASKTVNKEREFIITVRANTAARLQWQRTAVHDKKTVLKAVGIYELWTAATAKKPASAKLNLTIAYP